MRVLRLTLTAFGPYAKETVIDFESLGRSGLYIVTGDTGAGKTTIFDGISFALFGKPSGENRDGKSLRSKYAPDDLPTSVQLDFSYKDKKYRVERNPEYAVLSKRTGKFVTHAPDATLYYPDGRISYKVSNVDREIVELIGLTRDQFNRVAMIAQGEFLKLLLASTEERIKIFRRIFGTEKFELLQNAVSDEYNAAVQKRKELLARRDDLIQESEYADGFASLNDEETLSLLQERYRLSRSAYQSNREKLKELSSREQTISAKVALLEKKKSDLALYRQKIEQIEAKKVEILSLQRQNEKNGEEAKRAESLRFAVSGESAREGDYRERERLLSLAKELTQRQFTLAESLEENAAEERALAAERKVCAEKIEQGRDLPERHERKKAEAERAKTRVEERIALQERRERFKERKEALAAREGDFLRAREKFREESEKYLLWQEAFLRNQAGILAEELLEGEPCPVCGSLTHPALAKKEEGVRSEEEIKAQRALRDKREADCSALAEKLSEERAKVSSEWENIARELAKWGISPEQLDESVMAAKAEYDAIEEEERALNKAREEVKRTQAQLLSLEQKYTANREREGKIKESLAAVTAEQGRAEGALTKLAALRFASLSEMKRQVSIWQKQAETITLMIENDKKAYDNALKQAHTLEGEVSALKESVSAYSAEEHESALKEAEEVKREKEKIEEEQEKIVVRGKWEKDAIQKFAELKEKLQESLQRVQLLAPLYNTANGSVSGKERIRLETYVQMQYFDRVIYKANLRLTRMTDGQYELKRRETAGNLRSQAGLDLDVIDYRNNTVRAAATLSGGESFLASLALALGLSDEVQSGAGGIQLDCMFVDEGFGSLSDEALSLAIDTLESVSGGNVLIGIISHVDALRERIDKQIVVTRQKEGSKVEIVL